MKTRAYIALTLVCVLWGTTYFAIKIGIDHFPPFAFMGIRHTVAGILLAVFLLVFRVGKDSFTWKNIRQQLIPGLLMIGLGNGLLGWVEKYVPTGLIAILFALVPIYVVVYNLASGKREVPNKAVIAGIFTGLAGVLLIFRDSLSQMTDRSYASGLAVAFCCTLFWAAGSIISKNNRSATGPFFNTAIQLLSGGIFLLAVSLVTESRTQQPTLTSEVIWAMAYLIVFGSLIGFMAYVYAVEHLPLEQVTIHTYVNPLVAILLGWAFLGETVTGNILLATLLILWSVYMVNRALRKRKFRILKTNIKDIPAVLELYREGIALQKSRGKVHWPDFTAEYVREEINNGCHYKIMYGRRLAAVFSIVYNEPVIWEDPPGEKAVYLHRMAVHSRFRGNGLFGLVKDWMLEEARSRKVTAIRLDTWSESKGLTAYYQKAGFCLVGIRKIPETTELQDHYRNTELALFEMKLPRH